MATSQGKQCERFIFGYGSNQGQCYWEHGDCTEYISASWNLFDTIHSTSANVNPAYTVRQENSECLPNTSADKTSVGTFSTPQDCFNACVKYAFDQGSTCDSFIIGTGTSQGQCYWEHGPCTSYSTPAPYTLYDSGTINNDDFTVTQAGAWCGW